MSFDPIAGPERSGRSANSPTGIHAALAIDAMIDPSDYCRQLESYLCQKNEGHLVRIVGPAFEQVCGWAELGVPLKVAFRGIDRYVERYYARGPRRRPVRIEFCEADILELFDDWRRAVGITAGSPDGAAEPPKKQGLASHLERVVARLTALTAGGAGSPAFRALIEAAARELERTIPDARHARGEARAAIIARLAQLDEELMRAAAGEIEAGAADALRREAQEELAPFGSRMPPEARESAVEAGWRRLLREAVGLPVLTYSA